MMAPMMVMLALMCLRCEVGWASPDSASHVLPICRRCECLNVNPFSVDCNDMDLKEVPEFWKDLRVSWRFMINGNAITEIPVFPKFENLTSLSFKYNKISKIAEAAFLNLTNLIHLDLSHNSLTADSLNSEIFRGPYKDMVPDPIPLQELNLSYNQLQRLSKNVFKHLLSLESLDLSHNPFLDLSTKTAYAISELQNLKKLDMSYTQLRRLPDHFFAELFNLEELDLSGNDFLFVPAEVNYAHSLRVLSLNDNIFGEIGTDSFSETLQNLETLNLKGSKTLYRIENGAFGNLSSLQQLHLSENVQLTDIFPLAFTDRYNRTIHIKESSISEKNHLSYLPENALAWKDIQYLNLQDNPWNCDCNFEWVAKDLIPVIEKTNYDLTIRVTCAAPKEVMGFRVTDTKVQEHTFVCREYVTAEYGFVIVATIVVGTLLLVTGTIIFSYVLFRRTRIHDWIGENVKYKRTLNEEEDIITSNIQY